MIPFFVRGRIIAGSKINVNSYSSRAPWLLIPSVFIFIVVMAFNLLGDAVRDALDPRSLGF
ncbi:MAG: hypothetical protein H0Z25_00760 [Kosmotoga sp.]|nr:hypothetical protein [Kosmotoga sp.]